MNTKNKTYTIENLSQICNIVNDENVSLLILDLALWIVQYNEFIKGVRKKNKKLTKNILNSEIVECKFVWTDDGRNKLTGGSITNKATGETTLFNYQDKQNET